MSLIINHNAMAATTARTLNAQYGQLATATQRLSSGLRVNSAADDAAGLAIRELQRADIATLRQGARNANDAVSLIQTADGALQIIDEKLIRMKELAEQAATGTYDSTQRLMIDSEFQAMAAEINRIADATDFNGIHLLNGNLSGVHNGDGLNSAGAAKIHFGTGNDCAEDYYYIQIGAATTEALFQGAEGLTGGGAAGFDMLDSFRLPFLGDPEGQNVMALPNGNALILVNDHADRSLRMFEYTSDGTLVRQQTLPNAYPGDPAAGTMQPKECIVLPDGNMTVVYNSWGEDAFRFVTYDDAWNIVSNVAVPAGGSIGGPEDMAVSTADGSLLAGAVVGGNVVLAMTDDDGRNPRPPITLGPGGAATSTSLNGRHFVVANNAGALEGYFVNGAGTVSPPVALGNGSGARLASVGDKAVLTYSHTDPDTGKTSCYARVVNPDGSTGPELRINDADALNDNSVQDIDILRNPDGSLTNQVMISWKNSAGNGTLLAETFTVTGGSLTGSGGANMEFVSNIAGHGLGPNNIAVLNDGTVIGNWQEDVGGIDFNALGIFKVRWGGGELRIDTQEKAQKMLDNIDAAIVRKDSIRAHLGALQNRLENTISNLNIQAENLQTAESRISDTDVATEMTEFARTQILTQSATAMLAQANSLPKMALQVIQS